MGPGQRIGHTTHETSRIKLEINRASSISDRELQKKERPQQLVVTVGEKAIPQRVRKQVKDPRRYSDTTNTTSQTNRTPSDSKCIKIYAK